MLPESWAPSSGSYLAKRANLEWRLELSDNLQRRLFMVGSYEAVTLRTVFQLLKPTDIVLDVGANIGAFALPVARRLSRPGRVIAVEAASDTASILRRHVEMNQLHDRVTVVETGLSDHEGEASLRVSEYGSGDLGSRTMEGGSTIVGDPVRLTTGDKLCPELGVPRIDVIKIDVEGHERFVLNGLASTFESRPPRIVVMEIVGSHQARAGGSSRALVDLMTDLGYVGRAIRYRGLSEITPTFSGNAIFLREDPTVR
jgi:FkbM family methyltransferase